MNLAKSRLPLSLVATGGLMIIVSFLWGYLMPEVRINAKQVQDWNVAASHGHETASPDALHGATTRPTNAESLEDEEVRARGAKARAEIERQIFMHRTAPKFVNYAGVILAGIGCILYPLQLLARQAQVEAEQAEEDGTTVVE